MGLACLRQLTLGELPFGMLAERQLKVTAAAGQRNGVKVPRALEAAAEAQDCVVRVGMWAS
jgi:hypothetical protein